MIQCNAMPSDEELHQADDYDASRFGLGSLAMLALDSSAASSRQVLEAGGARTLAAAQDFYLVLNAESRLAAYSALTAEPLPIPERLIGEDVAAIATGALHAIAITAAGRVESWSYAGTEMRLLRVPPHLADEVIIAVAAGGILSMALTSSGQLAAWTVLKASEDGRGPAEPALSAPAVPQHVRDALSPRELVVLQALAGPETIDGIARRLHVSTNTIKTQTRSLYAKLGASSRRGAVRLLISE